MQEKELRKSRNILRSSLMAVALMGGVYGLFSCNSQESKPEPNETQTEEKSDVQKTDTLPQSDVKAAGDTATLVQTKKDETVINPVTNNNTPKQQDKLNGNAAEGRKVKRVNQNQLKQQDDLYKDVAVGAKDVEGVQERTIMVARDEGYYSSDPRMVEVDNRIYDVVENPPTFPGGTSALMTWLGNNITYPPVAEENNIQGRVIVSFTVEPDGSIRNVVVVKGVEPSLDKEAARVVKSMPKWNPGKQGGQAVRVRYNLPVTFKLQ